MDAHGEMDAHEEMDAHADAEDVAWGELPEDMVAKIQAQLSLVSLVRSRAVCKAWNEAVASPLLLRERVASRGGISDPCLLVMIGHCESGMDSCAYDPASDRWYQLQLPRWVRSGSPLVRNVPETRILELPSVSAGGGVLLSAVYRTKRWGNVVIPHIGNPAVARSWTRLQAFRPISLGTQPVRGVFVDATTRRFKLVAVQETRFGADFLDRGKPIPPTFVFDSALGSWSVTTRAMPATGVLHQTSHQGVCVGNVLYCLAGDWWNLMAYDLERASWSWLAVAKPDPLFHIFHSTLINVQGRVLCVALGKVLCIALGVVGPNVEDACLQIWELEFASMTWTAVDAMPAAMLNHFLRSEIMRWDLELDRVLHIFNFSPYKRIKIVAGKDCEVYFMQDSLKKIAALNLRQMPTAWRWLPSCPYKQFELVKKSLHCVDPWVQLGSWVKQD